MRRSEFSNSDALIIARWMVRTRLLETLCEIDPLAAFDVRIKEDFADLVESGTAAFAEAVHDRKNGVRVSVHFDDCRYEFGAAVVDGEIHIDRRSDYFDTPKLKPARFPRARDASA